MKKTLPVLLALVFVQQILIAQQAIEILESDEINCNVSSTGDLFNRFLDENLPGFEAPAGSGLRTMYAANLWIGGMSEEQTLKLAAETYEESGQDWFPGPLTNDGSASVSLETQEQWNQVWSANSEDVHNHQTYFNALAAGQPDPFQGSYIIPDWFFEWPAHGNISLGQDFYIAPFWDYNNNQFYDPENGDFPAFCGDQCLFFVFNDKGNIHTESQGQSIGLEIRAMVYSFDSTDPDIANTMFVKYIVINQGSETLTDTYVGLWNDFDLGNPSDDFVGTNVRTASNYAYNGDNLDEASSASAGYQETLPIQSMMILSGPYLDEDNLDNPLPDEIESAATGSYGPAGMGFGDGIADNERYGLCSSLAYANTSHPVTGVPQSPIGYYNYLRHAWLNGGEIVFSDYMYPGTSDPLNIGTDGVPTDMWNETTSNNAPGDRLMLAAMGPFTFSPGDYNPIDFAYVFSGGDEPDSMDPFVSHENREIAIKNYYRNQLYNCEYGVLLLSADEITHTTHVGVFPNPADDLLQISTTGFTGNVMLTISDATGRSVITENIYAGVQTMDVSFLNPGFYNLIIRDQKSQAVARLIVR